MPKMLWANTWPTLQDEFFKEWKGRDPWKYGRGQNPSCLKEPCMKATGQEMKSEGKSDEEIKQVFNTKVPMTVFAWINNKPPVLIRL